jgi:hypothetical protein
LPSSFVDVLDLLRRLVRLAGLEELEFQGLQSRFRDEIRMR